MKKIILSVLAILTLLALTVPVKANNNITVSVVASFTDNSEVTLLDNNSVSYGSNINVAANKQDNEEFAYWIVNGVVELDRSANTTFVATNNLNAIAIYYSNSKYAITFVDHSGKLIETKYVNSGSNVVEPIKLPNKIGYEHNNPKWGLIYGSTNSFNNVLENKVFKLRYKLLEGLDQVIVNGNSYNYNSIVTLTSNNPNFKYWTDEKGNILSYNNEYFLSALYDRNVIEVTTGTFIEVPIVTLSDNLNTRPGYITKLAQIYLPDDYTFLEAGYLVSKTNDVLTIDNATIVRALKIHDVTNEYLTSINNDYTNIRAYLIYKDNNGVIKTIYSNLDMVEYNEGFETIILGSGTSYNQNFNYSSAGTSVWEIKNVRGEGDYPISNKGIIMRQSGDNSYIQVSFLNGVESFSFQYRKAFTANKNREYKVDLINDGKTTTYTIPNFGSGSGAQSTVYTWNYPGLKTTGLTTFKIYVVGTADNQATFDNFKWKEEGVKLEVVTSHIVSFESNGGSIISNRTVKDGKFLTAPNNPTKSNNTFIGWFNNEELEGSPFDFNSIIVNDLTLYAKWEEIIIEPEIVLISDFGKTNSNDSSYSIKYTDTVLNSDDDKSPNGSTSWDRLGGNYNGSGWNYIKFGQNGVAANKNNPNNYLSTNFKLDGITKIELELVSVKAGTTIYLQKSSNNSIWVDVTSKTVFSIGTVTFDDLDEGDVYYRFVFANSVADSSNGWLLSLTTITFWGTKDNGGYPDIPDDPVVLDSGVFTSKDNLVDGWTSLGLGSDYANVNAKLKFDSKPNNSTLTTPSFSITSPVEVSLYVTNNSIIDSKLHVKDQNGVLLHTFTSFPTEGLISFVLLDTTVTKLTFEYEKNSGNLGVGSVKVEYILTGNPVFELHDNNYYVVKNSNWEPPVINATNFDGSSSTVNNDFNVDDLTELGTYQIEYVAEDEKGGYTSIRITFYVIEYIGQLDGYPNMNEEELLSTYNAYNNDRKKLTKKENINLFNDQAYYFSLTDLSGQAFVNELKTIISVTQTSYGEARFITEVSDAIETVWGTYLYGIYDNYKIERYWNGAAGYEREHIWPNSYLGQGSHPDNNVKNIQTDAHNIRAILGSTNSTRGNLYFVNKTGSLTTGHIVTSATSYYPGDDHKGDVARILMYMHVRYNDVLVLTDNAFAISNYNYANHQNTLLNGKIPFGLLSVLLQWHEQDPVDEFEIYRNNVIYEYQGNRNPFIDHPEYASVVFSVETSNNEHVTVAIVFINTDINIKELKGNKKEYIM